MPCSLPHQDSKLVQIVDDALADSERRSGEWLICKPGCTPCCIGVFAIDQLDVLRLQEGMTRVGSRRPGAGRAGASASARVDHTNWRRISLVTWRQACSETTMKPPLALRNLPTTSPVRRLIRCAALATCTSGVPSRAAGSDLRFARMAAWECASCVTTAPPQTRSHPVRSISSEADALQSELVTELEKSGARGKTIVAFALAGQSVVSG